MTLKLGLQHLVHEYYQICSNDDPELTMAYFEGMSNSVPYTFVWEKGKTVVVYDVKHFQTSFMGWGNESEYKWLMSHDENGCHVQIW